ncbi:hypothetical protein MYFR107205_26775 [Mycolicibacterium frederiksbergense]
MRKRNYASPKHISGQEPRIHPQYAQSLRKPVNQTLFQIRKDGTYNMLKEQWFYDIAAAGDVG